MRRSVFRALALASFLFAAPCTFSAQDTTSGGPDSVITGPYGVPRLVMNEGGRWDEPIRIFENKNVVTYVPDLTSPGWAQWHAEQFRTDGLYFTYLYIYRKDTRTTGRVTLYVFNKLDKVKIVRLFAPSETFDIPKAPEPIRGSITKITAIVQDQAERYRGPTIQDYLEQEREERARMVCSLTDSCPVSPTAASDQARSQISLPVPISTPEAAYSAEARRAKINGIVLLSLTVDTEGIPKDIRVLRPLGHGLDEAAVAAVRKYRFRPAIDKRSGKPVEKLMTIEVNFRLY